MSGSDLTQERLSALLTSALGEAESGGGFLAWRHEVAKSLELVREQRKDLVDRIARITNPAERGVLMNELELLGRKQELLQEPLLALDRIRGKLSAAFQTFRNGVHPQELAILHLAALGGFSPAKIRSDIRLFASVLFHGEPSLTNQMLEKRDERFLDGFAAFRFQKHPYQKEVVVLAEIYGISLDSASPDERYAAFIAIAKEEWRLELIRKGLQTKSAQELVADVRSMLESQIAEVRSTLEGQVERAETTAASERSRAKDYQDKLQKLEREVAKLRSDVSARDLGIKEERERTSKRRQQVLRDISRIRQEEEKRARSGMYLRFDPEYGVLMAEAWVRLEEDVESSEWALLNGGEPKAANNYYFLETVKDLIRVDDFEARYLDNEAKEVIGAINSFFAGECSCARVMGLGILTRFSAEQINRWLRLNFRGMQANAFAVFQRGTHPYQKHLSILIGQEYGRSIFLEEWVDLWDRNPAPFVRGFDSDLTVT